MSAVFYDMKYCKLRISWSVVCGIATVLLIVLWVRSYWTFQAREGSLWHVQSARGVLVVFEFPIAQKWQSWSFPVDQIEQAEHLKYYVTGSAIPSGPGTMSGSTTVSNIGSPWATLAYWMIALPLTALAAAPWIRRRFSLRTLLVATTLVAVMLGLIVWSTR